MADDDARTGAQRVGVGAARGVAATVAMSAVQVAWQHTLGGGPLAPSVVTDRSLRLVGLRPPEGRVARAAVRGTTHAAHGMVFGALYPVASRALVRAVPRAAGVPPALTGAGYGVALWAAAYLVAVPAAGLLPPATADRPARQVRLVAGHLVFGAVLGALSGRPDTPGREHRSTGS